MEKNLTTIKNIQNEYLTTSKPWFLGFSGGKDSSALLSLVLITLKKIKNPTKPVKIIYCDTGVEIPTVRNLAIETLEQVNNEAVIHNLPIEIHIVTPPTKNTFFVKVIGRGYPTPTNKFRWCTDKLRIDPIKEIINDENYNDVVVLLGTRKGESVERDKILDNHSTDSPYYYRQSGNSKALIYSPIIDYSIEDVWATLVDNQNQNGMDVQKLFSLYKMASGECPIIRDPKSPPCGKGRFGCWICTVVRRDKATKGLIAEGHDYLIPLFEFRKWILQIRDDPHYRCRKRRNGQQGPGPFTLTARKEMLSKLLLTQKNSGLQLIHNEEIKSIKKLWEQDRLSTSYCE